LVWLITWSQNIDVLSSNGSIRAQTPNATFWGQIVHKLSCYYCQMIAVNSHMLNGSIWPYTTALSKLATVLLRVIHWLVHNIIMSAKNVSVLADTARFWRPLLCFQVALIQAYLAGVGGWDVLISSSATGGALLPGPVCALARWRMNASPVVWGSASISVTVTRDLHRTTSSTTVFSRTNKT